MKDFSELPQRPSQASAERFGQALARAAKVTFLDANPAPEDSTCWILSFSASDGSHRSERQGASGFSPEGNAVFCVCHCENSL